MRSFACVCLVLSCASAPKVVLPSGWSECPSETDDSLVCGFGREGCAKLRSELQQCISDSGESFTIFVSTSETGAIVRPCLASKASQVHLDCVAKAMTRVGPVAAPNLTRVPLRIGVSARRVSLSDRSGLRPAAVISTVETAIPEIKRCLDAQHAQQPGQHGKLLYEWEVGADGRVTRIQQLSKEHAELPAAHCIEGVISRLQFPRPESPGTEPIVMPFVF